MVQHVPILMEATLVFVLMDGRATTAVKILTTVLMLRALMERLVSMALGISHAVVRQAKRDCFVTWTMPARLTRVTPTQFVKRVQSTALSHARALKATKDQTARRTSMNVSKVINFSV